MFIRYTDSNWARFKTHNKRTTWRTRMHKEGIYDRVKGSLFKPVKTGEKCYLKPLPELSKMFCALNTNDAILDGFDSLKEFKEELLRLSKGKIQPDQMLYCHEAKVIE